MNAHDLFLRYEWFLRPALRVGPVFSGVALLFWRAHERRRNGSEMRVA